MSPQLVLLRHPAHPPAADADAVSEHSLRSDELLRDVELLMARLAGGDRLERTGVMVQEHLSTGGKRIRARLALSAAAAMGAPRARAVGWAAACELLHNATLIHDDIQDGDLIRRGQPTTWVRHGVPQAINAGDLLLMLPFLAVTFDAALEPAVQAGLSRGLAEHAARTVRGQSEEMDLLGGAHLDRVPYLRAVRGKTGGLFALPVEGAAPAWKSRSRRDRSRRPPISSALLPPLVLLPPPTLPSASSSSPPASLSPSAATAAAASSPPPPSSPPW